MDIATIIGLVSSITLIILGMGDVSPFIDVQSFVMVFGGTIALTLISFPLSDVVALPSYIAHAIFPPKKESISEQVLRDLQRGALMLDRIKSFALAMGGIGVFIGAVIMLRHLDDPAALGPGAAICILTMFYGIVIAYVFCLPIRTKLEVLYGELSSNCKQENE